MGLAIGLWRSALRKSLLLTLILLPACASAAEPSADLPGPVTYEVKSWGRLLLRWQVDPDGKGEIWRTAEQKDKASIRKHRLRLEGDAMRTFISNVEEAREATKDGVRCDKEIFDLPYGAITWDYPGAKQSWSFDAGCRSEEADEVMAILGAATSVVETMAKVDPDPYVVEPAGGR